jgi:hypothetical protein
MTGPQDLPRVVTLTPEMSKKWGKGKMVIPAPLEVEEIMKKVPRGKVITINGIRSLLAPEACRRYRMPHHDGNFRLDCGTCGRGGSSGRPEEDHPLLADAENGGNPE